MRITNVISDLGGGGAERVMAELSNLWSARGIEVSVVVRSVDKPKFAKSSLDNAIPVSLVISPEIAKRWLPRTKKIGVLLALRKAILKTRPDVIIAYLDTVAVDTLLATIGTGIPVIVAEHCDPNARPIGALTVSDASIATYRNSKMNVREKLRQLLYPQAASVVCLTETALSFFSAKIRKKARVIPNPVLPPPELSIPSVRNPVARRVVYVGRLNHVKGLDRLLKAYAKIASNHSQWSLELWGEGPEEGHLKNLAEQLKISHRVRFAGWTNTPHAVLYGADLFVMSSYTEGFPMGLCEAMACGVPPVSFDCPSGPRHIIRHNIDGILVPNNDIDALATAMDHLMSHEDERARLASRAPEILDRFGTEKVLSMWDVLFRSVTTKKH